MWELTNIGYRVEGVIIGLKSYKNDAHPRYFLNYWPKLKKALH